MNKEVFVQNIKELCKRKNIYPTVACRESGVGNSFINDVERGKTPSVAKVQTLAAYLGVTTSELLGEAPTPLCSAAPAEQEKTVIPKDDGPREEFSRLFDSLTQDQQEFVIAAMRGMKQGQ